MTTTAAPPADEPTPRGEAPELIALLTPTGRDAAVARNVLDAAGLAATACADMTALCALLERGVGALLLAEEALRPRDVVRLLAVLGRQPPWSDVPIPFAPIVKMFPPLT